MSVYSQNKQGMDGWMTDSTATTATGTAAVVLSFVFSFSASRCVTVVRVNSMGAELHARINIAVYYLAIQLYKRRREGQNISVENQCRVGATESCQYFVIISSASAQRLA